ncbi:ABC transporter ATP-binding protein [Actinomyces bowdenii]|uniref:ABC transporter ATP-binding protein n=1 Tax=Actinomyces bowdenii TaxID=131109 RepID=UPI001ABCE3AE|nr:ABC transporter ATP-binding protein [Actinomyces bowdenii]MBO3723908.1 ABC transporter ATP-binding protein [Actinomyces bowdenii]
MRSSDSTPSAGAGQAPGAPPVLRARGLTKAYDAQGAPVLEGLDLDIGRGQFVAVMGPSGSGKSTLLHCLSGMDRPSSGQVLLSGDADEGPRQGGKGAPVDLAALDERELAALRLSRFGFVFQQAHLLSTLCLLDNIVLPGFLAGERPRPLVEARGRELMERMGIGGLAGSDVTEVSGGQLQRAGICRALINDPGIVFADEPTGALNSSSAAQILDLLGEVHASGTTLMVVTHDAHVAVRADRVLVLVDGAVVEDLALGRYERSQVAARLSIVSQALQRQSV